MTVVGKGGRIKKQVAAEGEGRKEGGTRAGRQGGGGTGAGKVASLIVGGRGGRRDAPSDVIACSNPSPPSDYPQAPSRSQHPWAGPRLTAPFCCLAPIPKLPRLRARRLPSLLPFFSRRYILRVKMFFLLLFSHTLFLFAPFRAKSAFK